MDRLYWVPYVVFPAEAVEELDPAEGSPSLEIFDEDDPFLNACRDEDM